MITVRTKLKRRSPFALRNGDYCTYKAETAIEATESKGPGRASKIEIAARNYLAMPQMFFRKASNLSKKKQETLILMRLEKFNNGDFKFLYEDMQRDQDKATSQNRVFPAETAERTIRTAMNHIYEGDMQRGISLVEGFGRADPDDENIVTQMFDKHPRNAETWPPPEATSEPIDMSGIRNTVLRTDSKTAPGPRGFHIDYVKAFFEGKSDTGDDKGEGESRAAIAFFSLGALFAAGKLSPWFTRILLAGVLVPLNKKAPVPGEIPDARPVKSEDADVASYAKEIRVKSVHAICEIVKPEQLGVGVSGGVQMLILGTQLGINHAKALGDDEVVVAIDLKNAHNTFSRAKANMEAQRLALTNRSLQAFATCFDVVTVTKPDIYMRSSKTGSGLKLLCRSESGSGQGNGLTGNGFVITIDSALKKVSSTYPGVVVKAIQDDINLKGSPEDIFGSGDDAGALALLLHGLGLVGLEPNKKKFQAYGNNEASRDLIPDWINQPHVDVIDENTGHTVRHYGINVCGSAVGDEIFVRAETTKAIDVICSTIEKTSTKLAKIDSHVAFAATMSSLKVRADHLLSLNSQRTLPLHAVMKLDTAVNNAYKLCLGFDPENPDPTPISAELDPEFTRDLLRLKTSLGGAGLRPKHDQALLLNTLACIGPQLLDWTDEKGNVHRGLWNSLKPIFGEGAFDYANIPTRWKFFLEHDLWYAPDMIIKYAALKREHQILEADCGLEKPLPSPLNKAIETFGTNTPKFHQAIFKTRELLLSLVMEKRAAKLPPDDHRRDAYYARHNCPFSTKLLGCPDSHVRLNTAEFQESVAAMFGLPSPACRSIINAPVNNSHKNTKVDSHGDNVKTASGVKGGSYYVLHQTVLHMVESGLTEAQIRHRKGTDTFLSAFNQTLREDGVAEAHRQVQGIVPDIIIDRRNHERSNEKVRLQGTIFMGDVKSLCSKQDRYRNTTSGEAVRTREAEVTSAYRSTARRMDLQFNLNPPGTIGPAEEILNRHGINGSGCTGLVTGKHGNLSPAFHDVRDLIVDALATKHANYYTTPRARVESMFRFEINHRWGLTVARAWARFLLTRIQELVHGNVNTAGTGAQSLRRLFYRERESRGTSYGFSRRSAI